MTDEIKIGFQKPTMPAKGAVVVFCDDKEGLSPGAEELDGLTGGAVTRAIAAAEFKSKIKSSLELIALEGFQGSRILLVGVGDPGDLDDAAWMDLGGYVVGKLASAGGAATVLFNLSGEAAPGPQAAANFALGARLAAYRFDKYKTRKDDSAPTGLEKLNIALPNHGAARKAYATRDAVGAGTLIARDLVNEPANELGPEEFAGRAKELTKVGVEVEILDEKAMRKLNMHALLAVGQGSARESRLVVMRWNGAAAKARPVAFVGKGVVFDTGGISIKPAAGMEDMKGDMAGAACVVGLMHALAARKAKVNAIGVIGLVENMPDGKATRPGDIIGSMSGQTIEVINTDAEGRLVLADALTYTQKKFKPRFMVNLATLTGAVIVALGHHNAGLFSNDDELSERLMQAGAATGERVWRLPLAKEYDKLIDSKFADMKNTGGRWAGSITAAQFLQRFVEKTPWAHLDIAGTGFDSPKTDINKSWASGFGVRLLDRLVAEHYEA